MWSAFKAYQGSRGSALNAGQRSSLAWPASIHRDAFSYPKRWSTRTWPSNVGRHGCLSGDARVRVGGLSRWRQRHGEVRVQDQIADTPHDTLCVSSSRCPHDIRRATCQKHYQSCNFLRKIRKESNGNYYSFSFFKADNFYYIRSA